MGSNFRQTINLTIKEMTQEEILEGNKTIAKFMEFEETSIGWYDSNETIGTIDGSNTFDYLKFDTSWDWLMEVVEKINNIKIKDYNTSVYIHKEKCYIATTHFNTGGIWSICITYNEKPGDISSIEKCYKAVIEFIKWYNKNKDL